MSNHPPAEETTNHLADEVLPLLAEIAGTNEVENKPDLPLYELQLLDSMKTVALIVALEEKFGLVISPAEFDRDAWATPQKLVNDIQRRLSS